MTVPGIYKQPPRPCKAGFPRFLREIRGAAAAPLPVGRQAARLAPAMRRDAPPLPKDGIYRTILWVLVIDIVAGVLLAILGETLLNSPTLNQLGAALALVGAALYVVFRILGAREARRRSGEDDPGGR